MWMQIAAGAAWLIWLTSGTSGLETSLTVGALLVLGMGMKNILDTFWKEKSSAVEVAEASGEEIRPTHLAPYDRGYPSSAPSVGYRAGRSTGHPALRGFERRFDNSEA